MTQNKSFKIGAPDWSLKKRADPAAFDVAREIGLDGLQVSLGSNENLTLLVDKAVQQQYFDKSKQTGIEIASLAIGELNRHPYKSEPQTEQWVADSIDVCNSLNINVVLLAFFGKGDLRDDPDGIKEVIRRLKNVCPKAEKQNVQFGLESWLSAWELTDIIQQVGSPALKVYYDVGNTHKQGYDIYEEIRFLGRENICEFHAKDYEFLFGQGKVNFPAVRSAMDDIGYKGWIQIEGETPIGLVPSYQADLKYLKTIFPPDA